MTRRSNQPDKKRGTNLAVWIGGAFVLFMAFSCTAFAVSNVLTAVTSIFQNVQEGPTGQPVPWSPDSAELTIAVSPVMAPVLTDLAGTFTGRGIRTPDGNVMTVHVVAYDPEEMIDLAAALPPFQAISPDSSLWLDRLEQLWAARSSADGEGSASAMPIAQRRVAAQVRYAVSPIVLAAWENVARQLGWPDRPVSWQDIQQRATQDPAFKWSHPNTKHASGLLAVLAEFYAGTGLTRGLTVEAATEPATLSYVSAVEGTVRFYGENEDQVIQRLEEEGRNFLDVFVAQERVVLDWNRRHPDSPLVALYPAEGTLWADHPLALLELSQTAGNPGVTENQRRTFQAFADFLASAEAQQTLLSAGYRPADLSIALDRAGSPFSGTTAVDWRQPQTTLQMPPPEVVNVVRDYWYYTKRPTNVYLVVDTSGSMEGSKLEAAQAALKSFLSQIRGDRDRVGIIEFGSGLKDYSFLQGIDETTRQRFYDRIDRMQAGGGTALIDAVYAGVASLQDANDPEAINAVVVMTDGLENESGHDLIDLQRLVRSNRSLPIVIFTIGFGNDADERTLTDMAQIGDGQFRRAGEADIEELYRIISTYF